MKHDACEMEEKGFGSNCFQKELLHRELILHMVSQSLHGRCFYGRTLCVLLTWRKQLLQTNPDLYVVLQTLQRAGPFD